jgi:hypothetical protein
MQIVAPVRHDRNSYNGVRIGGILRLPTTGLAMKMLAPGMVDTIGESSITFISGDSSDLMAAEFSFDSSAVMLQADTDEGGDVFFDSLNAMSPIVRTGAEWYDLLNGSFVWIGPRGVGVWITDQIAHQSQIQKYFGYYEPLTQYLYDPDNNILIGPDGQQMELI